MNEIQGYIIIGLLIVMVRMLFITNELIRDIDTSPLKPIRELLISIKNDGEIGGESTKSLLENIEKELWKILLKL